jgi:diadenosine tetraphosphate (Ap4A) HIT family hydrolase
MSAPFQEFIEKFRVNELEIASTQYWTWSIRPVHSTLGSGILSLKRFCTSFADITAEESSDIQRIVSLIESTLTKFEPNQKMNYVMLMMVDAHLHFHVIPRYENPVNRFGRLWEDEGWPGPPAMAANADLAADSVLLEIRDALRAL